MAGLLDNIDGDTILSGLLSAGAASGAKGPYLARVAAGLAQGERFKQGRAEQARQRSQDEMQAEWRDLMKKKALMEMARDERAGLAESKKLEEAARIDALIRNAGQVRGGMGAGLPAGTLPDDLSMPAQPALQKPGQFDFQGLAQKGVPFDRLKQLADAANLGRPEVARTMKGMSGGREVEQMFDKFGNPVGQGMEQFKAPIMLDRGGQTDAISPYTQPGASFPKTMSFSDKNAAGQLAVAQGNLALSGQRFAADQAKPAGTAKTGPMSVTLQKELLESDDTVQAAKSVVNTLKQAKAINDKAYSGYMAKGRATLASNLVPGGTDSADATIDLDNMMTGQALESLKVIFGGMPTEGERKILLDMQASADKTPQQRTAIMDRAIAAAERREKFAGSKAKAIRDGSYLTSGVPDVVPDVGGASGGWSKPKTGGWSIQKE